MKQALLTPFLDQSSSDRWLQTGHLGPQVLGIWAGGGAGIPSVLDFCLELSKSSAGLRMEATEVSVKAGSVLSCALTPTLR